MALTTRDWYKTGSVGMKRSELNDEAKTRLDDIIDRCVAEIEALPKSDLMVLDANLKKQVAIEKRYVKMIREILTDESNRRI